MDASLLLTGLLGFLAQVATLTIGTMRTMFVVQGRARTAFVLGALETSLWLCGAATVLGQVASQPALGVFYAMGFAAGNVTGIVVERWLALGDVALRAVSPSQGPRLARRLRQAGYAVTALRGDGLDGPVTMLYLVCPRRRLPGAVAILREDPEAFHCVDRTGAAAAPKAASRPRPAAPAPAQWDDGSMIPVPALLGPAARPGGHRRA